MKKANGLIAFSRWGDQYGPLFVMRSNGSGVRQLTRSSFVVEDAFPAWSPNGKKLAFLRGENLLNFPDADRADVYVLNAASARPRRLTNGLLTTGFAWSPDGKKMVYAAKTIRRSVRVYVMNADGSGKRVLTGDRADDPVWSPDGGRIAFIAAPNSLDELDVYVMNADGSHQTQLTRKMFAESPAWSPDGRRIAFRDLEVNAIFVVNADGKGLQRLTGKGKGEANTSSGGPSLGPYWSPDGKRIAFGGKGGRVYVMSADGSGLRPVTKGTDFLDGLAWSPDGKKIAYVAVRLGISGPAEQDIHVVNADGSGDRRLRNSVDEVGLSWQPLPRR